MNLTQAILKEIAESEFNGGKLDLSSSKLDENDAIKLAQALKKNPSIKVLDIGDNPIGDDGVAALAAVESLEELIAVDTELYSASPFKGSKLKRLDVSANGLVEDDFEVFAALPLEKLTALSCGITEEGMQKIALSSTIQVLDLTANMGGDEGLKALARMPNLRELRIAQNDLTSEGVQVFKIPQSFPSLRELDVSCNILQDEGVVAFKSRTKLQCLDVSQTMLRDEGVRELTQDKHFVNLRLARNGITDLTPFINYSALVSLDVSFNQIKDEKSVVALIKQLKHFVFDYNPLPTAFLSQAKGENTVAGKKRPLDDSDKDSVGEPERKKARTESPKSP